MPMQRNLGRSANRQINQESPREDWRMSYEGRRDEPDPAARDRDWDREIWDRDRDDEYSARGRYGRELDTQQVSSDRSERGGYGTQGYGYGSASGYGERTGYGRGYIGATDRPGWVRGREQERYEPRMWTEGMSGHRGRGPRNFILSDDRISERVCEALTIDDRIDASDIEVNVKAGEVTLNGTVDDRRAKRLAEDVIEDLPGVVDVQNRLRVRRGLFGKSGTEGAIDHLNSFLRGELAAVETYRIALEKLDRGSHARGELESCKRSHEERVQMLRNEIVRLGGTPSTSSGPWGVFARSVESGARVLGDKVAIAALEEGEDHGLKDYRDDMDKLDPEFRTLVRSRLLPAQEDTHSRMSTLKNRLS